MLFKINQFLIVFATILTIYLCFPTSPWWIYIIAVILSSLSIYLTVKFKAVRKPFMIFAAIADGYIFGNLISDMQNITNAYHIGTWSFVVAIFCLALMNYEYNCFDANLKAQNMYPEPEDLGWFKNINVDAIGTSNNCPVVKNKKEIEQPTNKEENISMVFKDGKYIIVNDENTPIE